MSEEDRKGFDVLNALSREIRDAEPPQEYRVFWPDDTYNATKAQFEGRDKISVESHREGAAS